jgi:ubiquinone/menaquinone biosynthesis C-methylase UbiE
MNNFVQLTEIAGDMVSAEQVERIARRYFWAGKYCAGKDVLEVACGTGQGVGYLAKRAKSVVAGDFSEPILEIARRHYGSRYEFKQFDAQQMPFGDATFDVAIIFEALYYLPDVEGFFRECRRVLRPGGLLLIATANKDLFDFTPSPDSHQYLGVVELAARLSAHGFAAEFFGDTPVAATSARQRLLRPVKMVVSRLGLMPKSMAAKKLLKRFVFGKLVPMPAEITADSAADAAPVPLAASEPDNSHKVILCAARMIQH